MTRPMNAGEAITEDKWQFECARSTRKIIQVSTGEVVRSDVSLAKLIIKHGFVNGSNL